MVDIINQKVSDIRRYAQAYYIDNKPLVTDEYFDDLVESLRAISPNHPILTTIGWGCTPVSDTLEVRKHLYPVEKFDFKIKDSSWINIPEYQRVVTYKLDGGSVIAYYEEGKFIMALTRGNGDEGLDVTNKIKALVPSKLSSNFTGAVRGEIIMPTSEFEKYKDDYKSIRNLSIGLLMRNELSDEDLSSLRFVTYKVRGWGVGFGNKLEVLNWLQNEGFTVVDRVETDDYSNENLRNLILAYDKYPIDGLIITSYPYDLADDGTTVQKDEVAYKTSAESVEIVVEGVEWRLTRTSKLMPKIIFDPVTLSGASVRQATAFNARFIQDFKIEKGTLVRIARSGEVIPNVEEVFLDGEWVSAR